MTGQNINGNMLVNSAVMTKPKELRIGKFHELSSRISNEINSKRKDTKKKIDRYHCLCFS